MVLGRQAFTELLGPLRELLDRNLGLRVLHSVPALKVLSPSDAEQVLGLFQSVSFAGGQTLLTAGQRYSTLFVVKSGAVRITKGRDSGGVQVSCVVILFVLGGGEVLLCAFPAEDMIAGGYFGEQALGGDAVSDCAVTAVDSVECFVLDRRRIEREFASLLPVRFYLHRAPLLFHMTRQLVLYVTQKLVVDGAGVSSGKVLSSPSAIASPAPAPAPSVAKPRLESDIKFGDLQHVAVLGSGTFGRVSLVRHVPVMHPE
jgi:CRP-like cAMP-binding protein